MLITIDVKIRYGNNFKYFIIKPILLNCENIKTSMTIFLLKFVFLDRLDRFQRKGGSNITTNLSKKLSSPSIKTLKESWLRKYRIHIFRELCSCSKFAWEFE